MSIAQNVASGMKTLTADESMTLAVDVACGASPSGSVARQ